MGFNKAVWGIKAVVCSSKRPVYGRHTIGSVWVGGWGEVGPLQIIYSFRDYTDSIRCIRIHIHICR